MANTNESKKLHWFEWHRVSSLAKHTQFESSYLSFSKQAKSRSGKNHNLPFNVKSFHIGKIALPSMRISQIPMLQQRNAKIYTVFQTKMQFEMRESLLNNLPRV